VFSVGIATAGVFPRGNRVGVRVSLKRGLGRKNKGNNSINAAFPRGLGHDLGIVAVFLKKEDITPGFLQ